jgi:PAS domain S-box-containing protein
MTIPDVSSFLGSTANQSNDELSNIFGQMPNGMAYYRMLFKDDKPYDYIYIFTNPAFHALTGLGAVEGKLFSEITPSIGISSLELLKVFSTVAEGGLAENIEIFIEGLQLWFSVQIFSPKPEHFIAIFFVINQRKLVEQALVTSEQRYKGLLEDQTEVICRFKADGTIIFVNEAFCRLFGKSQESLIGQKWQPVAWHEDLPLIHEKLSSLSPINPVVTIENRIIAADGALRWGQFVNRAFFNDDGVIQELQMVGRDITDLKQIELNLQTSESRFRAFMDNGSFISWMKDEDVRHVYHSKRYEECVGVSLHDWFGKTDFDLFPRHIADVFRQNDMEVLNSSKPIVVEEFSIDPDGRKVYWLSTKFPYVDSVGNRFVGGIGVDITDRKQVEEALRKSQRDLNHAQAVAHIGSWRIDLCSNKLEWSDETYRIFGIPKNTPLTYQIFIDCVHPADRQSVETAWKYALTGKLYDIEHRIIVDQKIKWVREQAELEFDYYGSLLSGFGTVEDITDLKSSQEALQHERSFLRQVIDAVPNVIFVKDREGHFLLGNQALAQSYGTSTEGLIGLTEESFNSNIDEVSSFYQNDLLVINSRTSKFIPDGKVTHADGSVHWYNTVKIPLIDNKECNKVLVVATDITDSKRTAEDLRLLNQRKDEFLAMLAHELRNPLAPIRNAVQLLNMQKNTDPTVERACNVIDRQVTHMVRLLDDLLDVARIMLGKISLKVERADLADIINNAVETCLPLIESRGQELIISQAIGPLWIKGDRIRLAQVLSNLLNNAAKYTNEGGNITLSVTEDGSDVVIIIRDTGIGISPDILPQVFDLFIQADHSLAHSQGGLGIGLTLVQRLVEKHGGTVTAASAGIGHGSSFMVRLPKVSTVSVTESEMSKSELPSSKYRILVVDDYADAAESLMMVLEAEGHEVEIANCGIKAIEQAQLFHPQVVLLDIGLPDMNGYEVAKRLRAMPETRDILLIALTGYGQPGDLELAKFAGFNHYLLKPVDFEKLFALLVSMNISGSY